MWQSGWTRIRCRGDLERTPLTRRHPHIGDQTSGRVGFFLHTDDFGRAYASPAVGAVTNRTYNKAEVDR